MRRLSFALFLLLLPLPVLRAEAPALLQEVAEQLVSERERWAFTQYVREFDGDRVVVERVERYDPARGQEKRWQLLKLNGRTPSPAEVVTWSDRKNRAHRRPPKAFSEYIDLEHARVHSETADSISYAVPFRRSAGGLFPGDKVGLTLTIDKKTHGIERAQVSIDESFKVALGLGEVVDLDMDLAMPSEDDKPNKPGKPAAPEKPQGTATAVVNKLGHRVEYRWTDFTRHEALPAAQASR